MNGTTWHSRFSVNQRMGKTLDLISNISPAMGGLDFARATDFGCQFEQEVFLKSATEARISQFSFFLYIKEGGSIRWKML
ncbi:hypothetical protein V8C40DRAFT_251956, partial [Trichoderma camerunense]